MSCGCEPPEVGCWKGNLDLLEKQKVLLTTEPHNATVSSYVPMTRDTGFMSAHRQGNINWVALCII